MQVLLLQALVLLLHQERRLVDRAAVLVLKDNNAHAEKGLVNEVVLGLGELVHEGGLVAALGVRVSVRRAHGRRSDRRRLSVKADLAVLDRGLASGEVREGSANNLNNRRTGT